MTDRDANYFRRRLIEERERALRAPSPETSAVHRAFARIYQQRLDAEQPPARQEQRRPSI